MILPLRNWLPSQVLKTHYLGIGSSTDAAMEFVLDEGYTQTLSIAPEGKFPVRRGNGSDPAAFSKACRRKALGALYPQEMIDEIVSGFACYFLASRSSTVRP